MAKLYGEIASKALLTLDKSFARANGQPLDASEVYYSLTAAQEYAAGAQAYIGQKIVVIENGVVTHYSVNDEAGTLKELGAKPVADGTTVTIGTDGKIALANVAEKAEGTYNAVLVNGVLTWVKPSETTVEGLSDLIQALTGRVDGHDEAIAANVKAIEDEAAVARAAEKALGERIDAIDFIDENEMNNAITAARTEISKEIDDDVKVAKDRADEAYELAGTKVDAEAYAADKKSLEDEDAAIREIAENVRDAFDVFMNSEKVDETVNTLKEIQAEIEKMTDATELTTALAAKADKTEVEQALAGKQDVIPANTYDAYGSAAAAEQAAKNHADTSAATAKSEAISAAAEAAAALYATQTALSELETAVDERLDSLESINHSLYATKEELEAHNVATTANYATKAELKTTDDKAVANAGEIAKLAESLEEVIAKNGEENVITGINVNGTAQKVENKTVNITMPTKVSDLTDDTGFDARITAAQNAADGAQGTANEAVAAAGQAQREIDDLETVVGEVQETVAGHTKTIGEHGGKIVALEQADIAHAAEYSSLLGIVSGHTEEIAKKANTTTVNEVIAKASANETAIKTLNETTIPGINADIAKKADASKLADYYTKNEINTITGTVAEGKTLVQMISDAQVAATYDDTGVKKLISDEAARAAEAEKANADEIARVNGVLVAALDNNSEGLDSIKELADWINKHGTDASTMAAAIAGNTDAIAAINHADTGILAQANAYADSKFAGIPTATAEALGLVKFDNNTVKMNDNKQLYVAKVSTDILEQGSQTLILNGGSARQ